MDKFNEQGKKIGSGEDLATINADNKVIPIKTKPNTEVATVNREPENSTRTNTIAVQPNSSIAVAEVKSNSLDVKDQLFAPDSSAIARQVVFADQEQNPEDKISLMTFSPKKNTMRGVFRKISRVFEKTTNVDDNKRNVLVGNFQIALK